MIILRQNGVSELVISCFRHGIDKFIETLENCLNLGYGWVNVRHIKPLDPKHLFVRIRFEKIAFDEDPELHSFGDILILQLEEEELIYAIEHLMAYREFGEAETMEFTTAFMWKDRHRPVNILLEFPSNEET